MTTTGLEVLDKSVQTTNLWLAEIMKDVGPDRQVAWHALGSVLHTLRDRLPLGLAAHLGAQLPLVIRGLYYDQFQPREQPIKLRSADEFLDLVARGLSNIRPVGANDATRAVFRTLNRFVDPGQIAHVVEALPIEIRNMWPDTARDGRRAG